MRLFRTRGYEETTVDDIAAAAGVGRRTFFRYFPSKEDAISPDHEVGLARSRRCSPPPIPPSRRRCSSCERARTVFQLYADDPELSVERFRLTHEVAALRDRESARVDHYRRLFTRRLRERFAGEPDGDLRAAVTGAAVVAAHNLALRAWLASGGRPDQLDDCRARFRKVVDMLPGEPAREEPALQGVTERLEAAVARLERRA
ncbi:TetR/AcrR family transcriptional regulator [Pseudonocardia cypriaca]|uniref:TetR/AcrR family transcriptional regulator n=1 Tax=Pseudonocardia cypriaca TaxID=882449 RepID=UPI0024827982|nr:TetR/AcrR family transcriptional regulator [Pseudonocardia cypriaca]